MKGKGKGRRVRVHVPLRARVRVAHRLVAPVSEPQRQDAQSVLPGISDKAPMAGRGEEGGCGGGGEIERKAEGPKYARCDRASAKSERKNGEETEEG